MLFFLIVFGSDVPRWKCSIVPGFRRGVTSRPYVFSRSAPLGRFTTQLICSLSFFVLFDFAVCTAMGSCAALANNIFPSLISTEVQSHSPECPKRGKAHEGSPPTVTPVYSTPSNLLCQTSLDKPGTQPYGLRGGYLASYTGQPGRLMQAHFAARELRSPGVGKCLGSTRATPTVASLREVNHT